jgi:hypothetical protein
MLLNGKTVFMSGGSRGIGAGGRQAAGAGGPIAAGVRDLSVFDVAPGAALQVDFFVEPGPWNDRLRAGDASARVTTTLIVRSTDRGELGDNPLLPLAARGRSPRSALLLGDDRLWMKDLVGEVLKHPLTASGTSKQFSNLTFLTGWRHAGLA